MKRKATGGALACAGLGAFLMWIFASGDGLADIRAAYVDRDYARAESRLRELLSARGPDPALSTLLGRVLLDRGHAAEARQHFQEVLSKDPQHVEASRGLAQALQTLGQPELALAVLQKVMGLDAAKNDPRLWKQLGQLQRASGDSFSALASFQRSLQLDPAQSDVSESFSDLASGRDTPAGTLALPSPNAGLPRPGPAELMPTAPTDRGLLPFQNPTRRMR